MFSDIVCCLLSNVCVVTSFYQSLQTMSSFLLVSICETYLTLSIFIACTDNLIGFSTAIEAVFPKTEIQNCIIHQLRNSSKYVSYKDIKALMADLKAVYAAVDEAAALDALDTFAEKWDKKYPKIAQSWRENWPNLSTYFKYPQEVRRLIYTTNAIEGFNR